MALLRGRILSLIYIFQEKRILNVVGRDRRQARASGVLSGRGESEGSGKTVQVSVSSLRIDAVAAAGLNISRQWV